MWTASKSLGMCDVHPKAKQINSRRMHRKLSQLFRFDVQYLSALT